MTESLRDALERVMGLVEKAQSGDWMVETPDDLPNEAIIRFSAGYVAFGGSRWGREANAAAVAAAITLFQQYGPALLAVFRDGERYRWLRDTPQGATHAEGAGLLVVTDEPARIPRYIGPVFGADLDAAADAALPESRNG